MCQSKLHSSSKPITSERMPSEKISFSGSCDGKFVFAAFFKPCLMLLLLFTAIGIFAASTSDNAKHWVGTWACAPYKVFETKNQPSKALTDNTLRQIVRVSIGGDTLRVKFSNITNTKAITLKSITIARSPDGTKCPVDAATITQLKFKGDSTVTIDAKSEVYSDAIGFKLTPSMRLAITTYYGDCQSSNDMTFHYGCRGNSYWTEGNKTAAADFANTTIPMWFTICGVDVIAPKSAGSVVCFGNSITDGYGLTDGKQNRWTDVFSEKLLANPATTNVGVLNEGIGATNVLSASNGAESGTTRFNPDVLNQTGVRWVIIYYGVNDIGNASTDITKNLKDAYTSMVTSAHAKGIKVYGATVTPFNGHSYYDAAGNHEKYRNNVNEWIRTSGTFDAILDFEKIVQDPSKPGSLLSKYSKDGLHPNVDGYKVMGESIDLKLFSTDTTAIHSIENNKKPNVESGKLNFNFADGTPLLTFEIPDDAFVSLKVYSLLGKEIAELAGKNFSSGKHSVAVKNRNLPTGTYIYAIKSSNFSASRRIIFPAK